MRYNRGDKRQKSGENKKNIRNILFMDPRIKMIVILNLSRCVEAVRNVAHRFKKHVQGKFKITIKKNIVVSVMNW